MPPVQAFNPNPAIFTSFKDPNNTYMYLQHIILKLHFANHIQFYSFWDLLWISFQVYPGDCQCNNLLCNTSLRFITSIYATCIDKAAKCCRPECENNGINLSLDFTVNKILTISVSQFSPSQKVWFPTSASRLCCWIKATFISQIPLLHDGRKHTLPWRPLMVLLSGSHIFSSLSTFRSLTIQYSINHVLGQRLCRTILSKIMDYYKIHVINKYINMK